MEGSEEIEATSNVTSSDPSILMEEILDILKVLNYEELFLATKGFKPLTRGYFISAGNSSEQFQYFIGLVSWLLSINGSSATLNKYDDPLTVTNNIVVELSKLGISIDQSPQKIRAGFGEATCLILLSLAKRALVNKKITFFKPIFPNEQEIQSEIIKEDENETCEDNETVEDYDEAVYTELKPDKLNVEEENITLNSPIWSTIDSNEWILEVERIGPRLKFAADPTGGDSREWRLHLEQTKELSSNVSKVFPDAENKLKRLADDMSKILEKITTQEKKINSSMGEIAGNYRNQANSLSDVSNSYRQKNEIVAELSSSLQYINDKYDELQENIESHTKVISLASPLAFIRDALKLLKHEGKDMELRGAVLAHSLFQSKLNDKFNYS